MKWLFVLLTIVLFDSTKAATAPFEPRQKLHDPVTRRTLSVRGGDLGPVKSKTLATIFSGLAAGDAAAGSFFPISSMKFFCGVNIEKGSLSEHYLHGAGASAATMALSSYLATSGMTSIEQAIGYGFVARLVSMTLMILNNKYNELGMNNAMFLSLWVLLAATTYALFTGKWEHLALTKVVALLLAFYGAFLFIKPEKFLKKAVGTDRVEPLTKDFASVDGGYMMISALVTGLLADGVDPEKVAGYASLGYVPVLIKIVDLVEVDSLFGMNTGVVMMSILFLLAAIIVGTISS